jgi:threonine synthase
MDHVAHLRCLVCHEVYRPDEIDYVCPRHGTDGTVDVVYDYPRIGETFDPASLASSPHRGMWRWRPILPVEAASPAPLLLVGDTPLHPSPRLAAELGLGRLWVKDDGRQPTASLKDRASAIAVVKAAERGAAVITTASTGNAAAALAGLCAAVGRRSVIFVPASAPPAKVAQMLAYGATVLAVEGTYDQAFELCLAAERRFGWYNRNTGYNPYMSEGKKTVALEVCEQLHWEVPDVIVVSVGDGCIIGGIHKGLRDLLALGWIDGMPRLLGVQAEGSNYLAEAWERGQDVLTKPPIAAHTVADSISAGLPRDRLKAMAAVTATGGAFVTVSDSEILAAIPDLARGSGVFAEPAAAASLAGLRRAVADGLVGPGERVVVISTGSGLKDIAAARRAAEDAGARPIEIAPDEDAVARAVADHRLAGEDEG